GAFALSVRARDEPARVVNLHLDLEEELLVGAALLAGRAVVDDEDRQRARPRLEARGVGVLELSADAHAGRVGQRATVHHVLRPKRDRHGAWRLGHAPPDLRFALPIAGLSVLDDVLGKPDRDLDGVIVTRRG